MITFKIPGEAKGKGRPKFARVGKFVKTYTPEKTASYENLVKLYFTENFPNHIPFGSALTVGITIYTVVPKSFSKKKRALALANKIFPTKKPDVDNISKIILDSLNTIAYEDDKQVVSLSVDKLYSDTASVIVSIWERV